MLSNLINNNDFIPLIGGASINLAALPVGVTLPIGLNTTPTTTMYSFATTDEGILSVDVPSLTPVAVASPAWLVPEF
jgi:hypothetical protein